MDAIPLLRAFIQQAHRQLEATMGDVTAEQAHWIPPGTANPIGATYAHVVLAEDAIIHNLLQGGAPLFATTWAGRNGVSEPMPLPGPGFDQYMPWTRNVRIDLPALREYAQAVYADTDAYVTSLTPEALDRTLDLTVVGAGQMPVSWIMSRMVVGHLDNICGEISCLKGLQGGQGYRF
jgi:hypothetical protein